MTKIEERIITSAEAAREFVTGEDGFVVWWPLGNRGGLSAYVLRILADELDRRNKDWEELLTLDRESFVKK